MDEDAERSSLFRGASPSRRAEAGGEDEAGAAAQVDDAAAAEPAAAPGLGEEDEDDSARSALFEGASPSKAGQEGSKAAEAESEADQEPVALNLEDLDITTHDIDFETIDGAYIHRGSARGRRQQRPCWGGRSLTRPAPRRGPEKVPGGRGRARGAVTGAWWRSNAAEAGGGRSPRRRPRLRSQNVDLRDYARALDRDLESACVESVGEYVEGAGDVARLHQQLVQCDDVLGSMQSVLAGFQSDLSGISDQIKTLQESSLSMNVQRACTLPAAGTPPLSHTARLPLAVHNRREAESRLKDFLDNVVVPPKLVSGICEVRVPPSCPPLLSLTLHCRAPWTRPSSSTCARCTASWSTRSRRAVRRTPPPATLHSLQRRSAARLRQRRLVWPACAARLTARRCWTRRRRVSRCLSWSD